MRQTDDARVDAPYRRDPKELLDRSPQGRTLQTPAVCEPKAIETTGLTAAQPVSYLEALPDGGHLALLVPVARAGYISRELLRRIEAVGARIGSSARRSWEVHLPGRPTRRLSVLT